MSLVMSASALKRLLIIIPIVVVLTLVSLFMPARQVSIEGVGTLSFETTVTLSVGSEVALAAPGTKTLYFENVGLFTKVWRLSETAPAAANEDTSVKNGKTSANNYFAFIPGTANNDIYSTSFTEGDADGAHGWRSQVKYNGSFASGNWTIAYKLKNRHNSAHAGSIYARIYRTAYDDPTTAQLSQMNSVDGFSDIISFSSADEVKTGSFTVNCNQNLTLNNEYVFIIFNWLVTTPGTNPNSGVKLVVNEGTAESVVTPEWTPATPDISNTPSSYDFGSVVEGETPSTELTYFTVTNNSSSAVNIAISGTDMTGGLFPWILSDDGNPGPDAYGLKAGLEGGDYTTTVKKSSPYNTLVSNLAASGTQKWGLRLYAPTTFSDGEAKTGTVTLTATF
jgi:hypothetical protein